LLLAAFLLTARSENYLSNVLLALFLIVSAIDSDSIFLRVYIYPNYPAIGLEMKGNFDFTKWWSLNANANLFHYKIERNVFEDSFSNSDFSWTAQLVNSFQIKKNT
jgi:hypothetical protein